MKTDPSLQMKDGNTDSSVGARAFTPPDDPLDGVVTALIIVSPQSGAMFKGPNITLQVTGTATFQVNGQNRSSDITAVKVRIGADGAFQNATLNRNTNPLSWSFTSSKTGLDTSLPITAQLFTQGTTPADETTITIQVDSSAPVLTISSPPRKGQ